jgi:3-hydroxyisobutyrate dehydrogenase/2-hydroxy-3-oxopropionate reductase
MKIGFIGVGVMGKSMVRNLLKNGFEVEIYARQPEKVVDVVFEGASLISSIAVLSKRNDVIITMVGFPRDVRSVYFDEDKILNNAKAGTIVIDMTTSSPSLAREIYLEAQYHNIQSLDCPVTGGDIGAKEGNLTIFGGGDQNTYDQVLPILKAMGKTVVFVGGPGFGQHAKLANQIGVAGAIAAVSEMIAYSKANGLDPKVLMEVWNTGSAASTQMKVSAPRALSGDMNPGFFIKHFIKDMNLAIDETENKGIDLKMLHTVRDMYVKLAQEGLGDLGTQALVKYYEESEKDNGQKNN